MNETFVWILVMGLGMLAYYYGRDPERNSQVIKVIGLLAMSVGIVFFGTTYASAIKSFWSAIGISPEFLTLANTITIIVVATILFGVIFNSKPSLSQFAKRWMNRLVWIIGIVGIVGITSGIALHNSDGWSQAAQRTGELAKEAVANGIKLVEDKIESSSGSYRQSSVTTTGYNKPRNKMDQCKDPLGRGWKLFRSGTVDVSSDMGTIIPGLQQEGYDSILICAGGEASLTGYGTKRGRGIYFPSGVRKDSNTYSTDALNLPWMVQTWNDGNPANDDYWTSSHEGCPDFSLMSVEWEDSETSRFNCIGVEAEILAPQLQYFALLALDHMPEMRQNSKKGWAYNIYVRP